MNYSKQTILEEGEEFERGFDKALKINKTCKVYIAAAWDSKTNKLEQRTQGSDQEIFAILASIIDLSGPDVARSLAVYLATSAYYD